MRNELKEHLKDANWLISALGWDKNIQGIRETQLTLGNGFIGSRGVLEEIPYDAHPGTYIAGVFEKTGSKVAELVNLPNPVNFKVSTGGEKLDVSIQPWLKHERYLNLKHGLLLRHTVYETANKNKIDYHSVRFFSMVDKNIFVMRIFITPQDKPCTITVESDIDAAVSNVSIFTEGRKTYFKIKEVISSEDETIRYVGVQTLANNIEVSYAHALHIALGEKKWFAKDEDIAIKLKKGETIVFTKYCAICEKDSPEHADIKHRTIKTLQHALAAGYDGLLHNHCKAWNKRWSLSDIKIKATKEIQKNLRFNVYHLLIAGIDNEGKSSVGARTLSGEGYRGHVFWDSEIFVLPFYIFTDPDVAKSMLLYRAIRLNKAREIAKSRGYKGAMFPWESALTGDEETPPWARNLDGSIIEIHTHEMEFHITADIAYAAFRYYAATDDENFMLMHGYELLFETARFWSSMASFNKRLGKYEIKRVIGPDEFHEGVNNNAYTNLLARWNVFIAHNMFIKMKKKHPKEHAALVKKLNLGSKEIARWKDIILKMKVNITKDRVIEQFDGFFKKKKVKITALDENFMPAIPHHVRLDEIGRYRIVKQSDVLMLLHLLSDNYDFKTKKRNYDFYAPITVHKSSLSPSTHSVMASVVGYPAKAYRYFLMTLETDIANLHRNTNEGIHAANLGGTWQAVIHGFAGMQIIKETLSLNPKLPKEIKSLAFNMLWKGMRLRIKTDSKHVRMRFITKRLKTLKVRVYGKLYNLHSGNTFIFKKK